MSGINRYHLEELLSSKATEGVRYLWTHVSSRMEGSYFEGSSCLFLPSLTPGTLVQFPWLPCSQRHTGVFYARCIGPGSSPTCQAQSGMVWGDCALLSHARVSTLSKRNVAWLQPEAIPTQSLAGLLNEGN